MKSVGLDGCTCTNSLQQEPAKCPGAVRAGTLVSVSLRGNFISSTPPEIRVHDPLRPVNG